jgi:hypothetical protein
VPGKNLPGAKFLSWLALDGTAGGEAMMPSEQAILDDLLIQQPPCSISRARLGVFSHVVLVKGKAVVAVGGKLLLAGLEIIRRVILAIP